MRIVLAPDSFKGTLSAADAAEAMARGVRTLCPDAEVDLVPLSDGGEGLLDVLLAACGGERRETVVEDPRGRRVAAHFGRLQGDVAVVEVAEAVGLWRLGEGERDPLSASSYGAGELIAAALRERPARLLVGLGGSATVDGGCGAAQALGVGFRDAAGTALPPVAGGRMTGATLGNVAAVDFGDIAARRGGCEVEILCDVTTPLVDTPEGPGAARLYGPQKGAGPADVERLAAGLEQLAAALGGDAGTRPGGGAAGGLGLALHLALGAPIASGIERVASLVDLEGRLRGADLVVTGEGHLDDQTSAGKVVAGVVAAARGAGVPVAAVVGGSNVTPETARTRLGLAGLRSCVGEAGSLAAAMAAPALWVERAAEALVQAMRAA